MFSPADTVVAIATPPGRGGIGIVRISGPQARTIASSILTRPQPLVPREATFTRIVGHAAGSALDQVVATYFPAPHSYTGDDVVEISGHGSPPVLEEIVRSAIGSGARLAEPGEFTFRAYLNGRMDLIQAEAVADLVNAVTPLQARAAFDQLEGTLTTRIRSIDAALFDIVARLEASVDFPEEGYHFLDGREAAEALGSVASAIRCLLLDARRGRLVREGVTIAIVGRPNVGKSSLFNALVGSARAIVSDRPGTTRDLVTETVDLDGLRVRLVDTAGIRATVDDVEREGVKRAEGAAAVSQLVIVVLDRSRSLDANDERLLGTTAGLPRLIVVNKIDCPAIWTTVSIGPSERPIELSLKTGDGVDALRPAIAHALLGQDPHRDTPALTNIRHATLLDRALDSIDRAGRAMTSGEGLSEEFVLADLQAARAALEEIVGARTPDDVLTHIFEHFCVGK